jgi:hypothetical protein
MFLSLHYSYNFLSNIDIFFKGNHLIESIFQKEQILTINKYKTLILKYIIAIQTNWILIAIFIFYIVYIVGYKELDKVFNQACLESIVNQTRSQVCPASIRSSFFNWKNEIFHRKLSTASSSSIGISNDEDDSKQTSIEHSHDAVTQSMKKTHFFIHDNSITMNPNKTYFSIYNFNNKTTTIEDIYLLLISVALVNFFVSLAIPLILIKSNKQSKKIFKSSISSSSINLNEISENKKKKLLITNSDVNNEENTEARISGFIKQENEEMLIRVITFYDN